MIGMYTFGLTGKITAQAGQRDTLVQVLLEAADLMKSVEGCKLYIVSISETEPEAVFVTEIWTDSAAHQASLTIEEIKAIIQRGRPFIAGFESTKLQPMGGKGL
jgi:quinol monooxygenase YgiN